MKEEKVEKKGLKLPKDFSLTNIEKEVLHLISEEFLTIKQIAQRRDCSIQAVYKIMRRLKKKGYMEKKISLEDFSDKLNLYCYFCDYFQSLDKHHIVERQYNGLDEENNYLYLCPNCHKLLHSKGVLSFKKGFYVMLDRKNLNVILRPSTIHGAFPREQPISSLKNAIKLNKLIIENERRS
jgi:DNA-binding CsgD family transcriptional regulator